MNPQTGKYVIVFGLAIVLIGVILYFFSDRLQWIGRLPGDIRIEKENFRLYMPLTTMLLISVVVSLLAQIAKRL